MAHDLLLINCRLFAAHAALSTLLHYVEIRRGRIVSIGPMSTCLDGGHLPVIDAAGMLLIPGLVNGHNHCAMTLFRGLADDLELSSWLHDHIFPAEAVHVSPDMVYWCTLLAAAEMLLSGTTTVADGYFFSDRAAQALDDAGMRAVVAHGIVDFPVPSVPDPADNIATVSAFAERWKDRSTRIRPGVFAHAPYTCSPHTLRRAKALADKHSIRFFIHLAETRDEQQTIIDPQGETPLRHLANLRILDENCTLVHATWLADDDLAILAASGASVVTCPQSNLKLAAGIARITDLLARNIPVGIGTDGCASNNSLDLFREMDILAKIQKAVPLNATALPAGAVLRCATVDGARAIGGLPDQGRITPGAPADLVLIDCRQPHLTPLYNRDLIVYAAAGSDVQTVIIDGRPVVVNRRIQCFDLDEVFARVKHYAAGLHR